MLGRDALLHEASRVAELALRLSLLGLRHLAGQVPVPGALPGPRGHERLRLLNLEGLLSELGILVLTDQLVGRLLWLPNLEQGVLRVDTSLFASFAEVSIRADRAHITNANDWIGLTAIADDTTVLGGVLLRLLVLQVVNEHAAEASVEEFLDFLADHGSNSGQLLGDKSATAVALPARKALLVHLGAVALDASDLLKVDGVLVVRWDQQVAGHILLLHLDLHLTGLVLHLLENTIAAHVADLGLDLARGLHGLNTRVDHLLLGLDAGRHAASLCFVGAGQRIAAHRDALVHDLVGADSHFVLVGNEALGQLRLAGCIIEDVTSVIETLSEGAWAAKTSTSVLTHHLRHVDGLSEGSLVLQLGEQLLTGIARRLGDSEAKDSELFVLECLGEVRLRRDGDDLVVLVQVEELELWGQVLEG